jgi:hypothetical protein
MATQHRIKSNTPDNSDNFDRKVVTGVDTFVSTTTISGMAMDKLIKKLDNPPVGTASLEEMLQTIRRERRA